MSSAEGLAPSARSDWEITVMRQQGNDLGWHLCPWSGDTEDGPACPLLELAGAVCGLGQPVPAGTLPWDIRPSAPAGKGSVVSGLLWQTQVSPF